MLRFALLAIFLASPAFAAEPLLNADLPRIKPKHRFSLPGKLRTEVGEQSFSLSDDGKRLAVAHHPFKDWRTATQVWDLSDKPKVLSEFKGPRSALSPSGKLIATEELTGVYDVARKEKLATPPNSFTHAFFQGEDILVSTNRTYDITKAGKGRIQVWDVQKNADAGSFNTRSGSFSPALPGNDRKEIWLFMTHPKYVIECYDIATKKLVRTVTPESDSDKPNDPLTSSGIYNSISSDSSVFFSAYRKGLFRDAKTGEIIDGLPQELSPTDTGFLPTGMRYLARLTREGAKTPGFERSDLVIYDWKTKKALAVLTDNQAEREPTSHTAASGDGKTIVNVTKEGEVRVFDISSVK